MTRQQLERAWTARPFRPFLMHLPYGRSVRIPHPEFLSLHPTERVANVWFADGSGQIIDLMLVSDIEFLRPRRSRRSA